MSIRAEAGRAEVNGGWRSELRWRKGSWPGSGEEQHAVVRGTCAMREGTSSTATAATDFRKKVRPEDPHGAISSAPVASLSFCLASPWHRPAIQAFAQAYMKDCTGGEVAACLNDPEGFVHDTILALRGTDIVGLAQVARRTIRFGPAKCKVGALRWLHVSPEFRGSDLPFCLLEQLEQHARRVGLHLAFSWNRHPQLLEGGGWASVYRPPVIELTVEHVLAEVLARGLLPLKRSRPKMVIRPVRLWDVPSLTTLYEESVRESWGAFERSQAYWKWLVDRRGFDQFYVAVPGGEAPEDSPAMPMTAPQRILGYYVRRGWRIVEFVAPSSRSLAIELLVHACREAKEQNRNWILIDLPAHSPLRRIVTSGRNVAAQHGEFEGPVLMAKVLDLIGLIQALLPYMQESALRRGLRGPVALGLDVASRKIGVTFDGQRCSLTRVDTLRHWIRLSSKELLQLLCGGGNELGLASILEVGRTASSPCAVYLAKAFFCAPRFWRSTFDDLPSVG